MINLRGRLVVPRTPGLSSIDSHDRTLIARQHHASFQHVLQFAHVAWPMIFEQLLNRGVGNRFHRTIEILAQFLDEVSGQVGNVFLALAQRRNVDGHDVEAVVEILAEGTLLERGA